MGANSRVKAQRRFERLARQRVTRGSSQLYVGGSASAGFLSEPLVVGVETRPITRLGDPPTITPERRTAEGVPAAVPGVRFLQAACPSCCFLAQRVHWSLPKDSKAVFCERAGHPSFCRGALSSAVGAVCGEWRVRAVLLEPIGFSEWPPFCYGIVVVEDHLPQHNRRHQAVTGCTLLSPPWRCACPSHRTQSVEAARSHREHTTNLSRIA